MDGYMQRSALVLGSSNTMGLHQFSLQVLCYIAITSNAFRITHGTLLTVQNTDNLEQSDVTLRCSNGRMQLNTEQWKLSGLQGSIGFSNNVCSVGGFLIDKSRYAVDCTDGTVFVLTVKNISREFNGKIFTCGGFILPESNSVTIYIIVPVKSSTISPYSEVHTSSENSTISLQCTTSECRPEPKFLWYINNSQINEGDKVVTFQTPVASPSTIQPYTNSIRIQLTRELNGWYIFCAAVNYNGIPVPSDKILLNITYPPDGPPRISKTSNSSELKVFRKDVVHVVCSVTGGNPLPVLWWNKDDESRMNIIGKTVTKNLTWQATGSDPVDLICQSLHPDRNETSYVTVHILFPPEKLDVTLMLDAQNTLKIKQNFSVIENTSNTMVLICSAISNPSPSSYWWTGSIQSSSARLELNTTRNVQGIYTCNVNNTMIAQDGRAENGFNSLSYAVDILELPTIRSLQDVQVVEGKDFNTTCYIIGRNDMWRSVKWFKVPNVSLSVNERLFLTNITKSANGTYMCRLDFSLQPTYGLSRNDTIMKGFNLEVLYKAKILSLSINNNENNLTVNETARVHFVCKVDSNPNSTVEITFNDKILLTNSNTQTLEYMIDSVNCSDTGTYVCAGSNAYNIGEKAKLDNILFVLCSPRRSPSFELKQNVTSALDDSATFQFTAMAYPRPRFQWYRVLNESETTEVDRGAISDYSISTIEMQTHFTLNNVNISHYGEYLLKVENEYGTFNQSFFLIAKGKPNPPTYYDLYPDSVTSDSVTIWWEPGFDGGLPQSFIISYNLTASKWYNVSAISHNKELRMNKTISKLASGSVYHILIYSQNEKGSVLAPHAIIVNTKEATSNANPINVGAAAGAVGGLSAIVVVIVVAVVITVRKRSLGKQKHAQRENCDFKDTHTYTNVSKGDTSLLLETKETSLDLPKLPERIPMKLAATHNLQELDDYDDKAEERIYGNTYEMIKRIERINVSELLPYLMNKPTDFFGSEFTKLPKGLTKPYDFSQKPENIALNRYNGIYPYDHSRVKIYDEPSFFINACYIDGYKKKKAFIASLGPLSKTTYNFVTFWKMVWSEKSDVIVMLTKLTEPSGVKCDPYWPNPESTQEYGDVTVTSVGEDVYSDYVLRNFTLSKENEKRKLIQFHFMAWPDKSIPEDVTCLLEFRKRVNSNHSSGPIIVHCSAGIGRTGTLIAIEILIEEGRRKGSVNVAECVRTMRDQRTSMVQILDQYHYIYKALVNALVFDCEAITPQKFKKYVDKTNKDQFNKMFQTLNQTVEADSTSEGNARTANKMQRDKNRMGSDIPGDSHRVRLLLNRDEETSVDYINAVYVDSFTKNEHFVVAQTPMINGVEDFLCMIYQVDCTCIVSLDDNQQGNNVGMYTPADNTNSLSIGSFNVNCKVLDTKENYVVRKMKIEFKGKYEAGEKDVYYFEYTDWASGQKTPSDPHSFVQFTREVEEFARQLGKGKSQVLVHCLNAYERSCLFCAVVTLVEKVKYEGEVCVSNTLRHIRARRKLAIPNMEQFQFCFRAVCAYINMDTTESSIEEKAYINTALA